MDEEIKNIFKAVQQAIPKDYGGLVILWQDQKNNNNLKTLSMRYVGDPKEKPGQNCEIVSSANTAIALSEAMKEDPIVAATVYEAARLYLEKNKDAKAPLEIQIPLNSKHKS